MRIVSIINQKGGCGKTTTAINLAGIFARRGCRTLLVDLDPQSHCAAGLAIPEQRIDLDIGDAMLAEPGRGVDRKRLLWRASRNLDLAPSRTKLAGLEALRGGLADKEDAERRLGMALSRLASGYDVCFVDCSPSIGLLTFNALAAATHILIPVETSFFALQGATKQLSTVRTMARRLGASADHWVVATLHDESSVLSRDLLEEMRRRFNPRVAPVAIRRDTALKEAASFGQPVIEYAPNSAGASDYGALADWLGARLGLMQAVSPPSAPVGGPAEEPGAQVETKPAGAAGMQAEAASPDGEGSERAVVASPQKDLPADDAEAVTAAPASRASSAVQEDAERTRLMLLKRADEQLRRIIGGPEAPQAIASVPMLVVHPSAKAQLAELQMPGAERAGKSAAVSAPEAVEAPEHIRNFYGARQTRSGVLFVQPLSLGMWIGIAGDFNNWTPRLHMMRRNEELGVFELCVPLESGRRRYRLVVDGRWITDPSNPRTEPNEYGELNSIIDVTAPQGAASEV